MKKQILILFMAIMASYTISYSQEITPLDPSALNNLPTYCVPAIPVAATCVPAAGPLNPIAGQEYVYEIEVLNGGASPVIHWFATTDENFITTTGLTGNIETLPTSNYLMAHGSVYNNTANTSDTVHITWKSFQATETVYLVTYVKNTGGCTDNIQVYKIEPVHLFTLDLARMDFNGALNASTDNCVSPVISAIYDIPTSTVIMDFGVDYLYYVVNAANWAHSWKPSFQITTNYNSAQATMAVDWAYPTQSFGATPTWNATTPATAIVDDVAPMVFLANGFVAPATTGSTGVGASGECIIVRVTVDHNKNETLADISVDLGVTGTMYDQVAANYTNLTLRDIHHTDGGAGNPCPWYDEYTNDHLAYTLTRRPTVNAINPTPFENTDAE